MSNELYIRQLLSALAVAIALGVGFLCGNANAAPLGTATLSAFRGMAEPFGIGTSELKHGGLFDKWRAITRALPREMQIVERCREDMDACPAEAQRSRAMPALRCLAATLRRLNSATVPARVSTGCFTWASSP